MSQILRFISIAGQVGAGKSSLAGYLEQNIPDSQKISYGEMYRSARDRKEGYAHVYDSISPYIESVDSGNLLPDEPTVEIVRGAVEEGIREGKRVFILDGFPRTMPQLRMFEDWLKELRAAEASQTDVAFVNIDVDEAEAVKRNEGRSRFDDEPEVLKRRLRNYPDYTEPMLQQLEKEGSLVSVDGNKPTEEVFRSAAEALRSKGVLLDSELSSESKPRRYAIILAGGKGTRMDPEGASGIPKPMVEIAGKPLLEWQIEQLKKAGITHVLIYEGYLHEEIEEYFGDGRGDKTKDFDIDIIHFVDPSYETRGTAGAAKKALEQLPDQVDETILMWGDIFTTVDIASLVEKHHKENAKITFLAVENQIPFGVLDIDEGTGTIRSFLQKPPANGAIFVVSKHIKEDLPEEGDFSLAIQELMRSDKFREGIYGFRWKGPWFHVGDRPNLEAARRWAEGQVIRPGIEHE